MITMSQAPGLVARHSRVTPLKEYSEKPWQKPSIIKISGEPGKSCIPIRLVRNGTQGKSKISVRPLACREQTTYPRDWERNRLETVDPRASLLKMGAVQTVCQRLDLLGRSGGIIARPVRGRGVDFVYAARESHSMRSRGVDWRHWRHLGRGLVVASSCRASVDAIKACWATIATPV